MLKILTLLVERRLAKSTLLVSLVSAALSIAAQRLLINTPAKGWIEPRLEPLITEEATDSLDIIFNSFVIKKIKKLLLYKFKTNLLNSE